MILNLSIILQLEFLIYFLYLSSVLIQPLELLRLMMKEQSWTLEVCNCFCFFFINQNIRIPASCKLIKPYYARQFSCLTVAKKKKVSSVISPDSNMSVLHHRSKGEDRIFWQPLEIDDLIILYNVLSPKLKTNKNHIIMCLKISSKMFAESF